MRKKEKKAYVLRMLEQKRTVSVAELCEIFDNSAVSVRKLLADMEKNDGSIQRIWGGAVAANPPYNFEDPPEQDGAPPQCLSEAEAIAREAYAQIQDGDTVFLGCGSPALLHLASMIIHGNKRRVIVSTNAAAIAFEFFHSEDISKDLRIILIGGEASHECQYCLGKQARQMLEDLSFDKCFLSVNHFSIERGFSAENMLVADVQRTVLASSKICYFLVDYSAFGKDALSLIAPCEPGKRLITGAQMPAEVKARLEAMGLQVILVSSGEQRHAVNA